MKKTYIQPNATLVDIRMDAHVLTGSNDVYLEVHDDEGDREVQLTKRRIWTD